MLAAASGQSGWQEVATLGAAAPSKRPPTRPPALPTCRPAPRSLRTARNESGSQSSPGSTSHVRMQESRLEPPMRTPPLPRRREPHPADRQAAAEGDGRWSAEDVVRAGSARARYERRPDGPLRHRKRWRSTNLLERSLGEVRPWQRRVVGDCFAFRAVPRSDVSRAHASMAPTAGGSLSLSQGRKSPWADAARRARRQLPIGQGWGRRGRPSWSVPAARAWVRRAWR